MLNSWSLNEVGELLALRLAEMLPHGVIILDEEAVAPQGNQVLLDLLLYCGITRLQLLMLVPLCQ